MPVCSSSSSSSSVVALRLYRWLYRASIPFTPPPYGRAAAMNCLLHRTGREDNSWIEFIRKHRGRRRLRHEGEEGEDDDDDDEIEAWWSSKMKEEEENLEGAAFRKLLQEVVGGDTGMRQMQFPRHVVADPGNKDGPHLLRCVIQREFRGAEDSVSVAMNCDDRTRIQIAFRALRELNKKIAMYEALRKRQLREEEKSDEEDGKEPDDDEYTPRHPRRRRIDYDYLSSRTAVLPLPFRPASSYLRPGAFLVAHPLMTGYFRRSVICILDHNDGDDDDGQGDRVGGGSGGGPSPKKTAAPDDGQTKMYGTYGLVVNRPAKKRLSRPARKRRDGGGDATGGTKSSSSDYLSLREVLRPLPDDIVSAFGRSVVREGGPVHMSLQMIHSLPSDADHGDDENRRGPADLGGVVVPMIYPERSSDDGGGAAISPYSLYDSDRVVKYRGDVVGAAECVLSDRLDRDDVAFYVGASCWTPGQLESEMERGFWLPCAAPPGILLRNNDPDALLRGKGRGGASPSAKMTPAAAADEISEDRPNEGEGRNDGIDADHDQSDLLWLYMLSSCGREETELANIVWDDDDNDGDVDIRIRRRGQPLYDDDGDEIVSYAAPCDDDID